MNQQSRILLRSIKPTKKTQRRERYMSIQLGRVLNGIPPTDFQSWYSKRLSDKTSRRLDFTIMTKYPTYRMEYQCTPIKLLDELKDRCRHSVGIIPEYYRVISYVPKMMIMD